MRGLAAICVVLMHGKEVFGRFAPASAYLAVDFFFVLSGFVIAHAYEERLASSLSPLSFMKLRVVRLYPLYLAGSLSSVALAGFSLLVRHDDALWRFTQPEISLPFALLMLPSPASASLFPLDVPAWTLLFELVANAAYAFRAVRSQRWLVAAVVAGAAVALAVADLRYGSLDLGSEKASGAWGLARVLFGFPTGALLYRLHSRVQLSRWWAPVLLGVLVALMLPDPQGVGRTVYDLALILFVSPCLVLAGAAVPALGKTVSRLCIFLGTISYPLYVLHQPTLHALFGTLNRHAAGSWLPRILGLGAIGLMVAASWYAARLDSWLRPRLMRSRLMRSGRTLVRQPRA